MQPDIDAAMTIRPADDASDADNPAAVVRSPSPVVAETERPGEVAGDADTQAAAVATPTWTPDHHNTPRTRSVQPGDGADTLPDVGLSEEEVRQIFRRSSNPGLFAAHLTHRVFPELFTDAQQKHHFNFYGGGTLNKQPLSPTRRDVVRRLTVQHYPEVVSEGAFKAQCVSKVNELLRGPVRKQVQDMPPSLSTDMSFTALMEFTDL